MRANNNDDDNNNKPNTKNKTQTETFQFTPVYYYHCGKKQYSFPTGGAISFLISEAYTAPVRFANPIHPACAHLFHFLPAHLAMGGIQPSRTHLSPSSPPYAPLCHLRGVLEYEDGRWGSDWFGQWWVKCPSLFTLTSCWTCREPRAGLEGRMELL